MTDANRAALHRAAWLRQQAHALDFQCAVQRAVLRATLPPFQARLLAVSDRPTRRPTAA